MTEPVVLFAPIGPNPAPLSELIYALHRQRDMRVVEAFVVVDRRGLLFLEAELLRPGEILDQLRAVLGADILDRQRLHVRKVLLEDGSLLLDDHEPSLGRTYSQALWAAAREAIAAAGARRVIFGLVAGRRRTMTALQASMYQLLARPHDLLIDVRVSDARVEGGSGFFFPEQSLQDISVGKILIPARGVEVVLVDVIMPRLRGLLREEALGSYESAARASQLAVDEASLPRLAIDLVSGRAAIDAEVLELSAAELVWYAYLAAAAPEWVIAGRDGHEDLRRFVRSIADRAWVKALKTKPLLELIAGEVVDDDDLRNLRGKTVQRLKSWCAARKAPPVAALLVPEVDARAHRQRISLSRDYIAIDGLPGV